MSKPALITTLEQRFSLAFTHEEATDSAIFSRYGRKEVDACRYWLRAGDIVGLCARASGVNSLDWLSSPALDKLEVLLLGENTFTDITIPENWTNFQHLDLNASPNLTSVGFAGELCPLTRLEITDCPALTDLVIPDDCPKLHYFDVNRSNLKRLELDGNFSGLVYLDAGHNKNLKRVSIAGNFASLLSLHLRAAALETLNLTADFPALDTLDLAENPSSKLELPAHLILDETLLRLYAEGCAPKNCRSHFLKERNAIDKARTWFRELAKGETKRNKRIKLLFTGNGNVGKSTLLCALRAKSSWQCTCTTDHLTTHGIQIGTFAVEGVTFSYWDFGGQDVYGATHQLFYADEAVQLIVFDANTEALAVKAEVGDDRAGGQEVKHELPYFYYLLSERSSQDSFLFVQNKVHLKEEMGKAPQPHPRMLTFAEKVLPQQPPILVDAKDGFGVESLMQRILPLARQLPHYDMAFPATWLAVRNWFIANERGKDEKGQVVKQERRITKDFFVHEICERRGVEDIEAQEALLEDLAAAGYCYYRPDDRVLGQEIIVDQGWALEAIYRPFHREDVAPTWRRFKGRIPLIMINEVLGPEYDDSDKALLLKFMVANGLCFPSGQLKDRAGKETVNSEDYIFPVYLPAGYPEALVLLSEKPDVLTFRAQVPFLNRTAFQYFLFELGRKIDSFDDLSRYGIFLKTKEGRLGARMNYDDKCYEVFCEPAAQDTWLKSLLEECPGDNWETKTEEGYRPFDAQEASGHQGGQEEKSLKKDLSDRIDALQEAPLSSRRNLETFQEQLDEQLVANDFNNFFAQLKEQLVTGGKRYMAGRLLQSQYNGLSESIINRTIRKDEQEVQQSRLSESCINLIYRLEVEDWKGVST